MPSCPAFSGTGIALCYWLSIMISRNYKLPLFFFAAFVLFITALAVFYRASGDIPLETLRGFLERAQNTPGAFFYVCVLYVLAGAVFFPITVTNLATAMVFGAFRGILYGLAGSLLSACVFFWAGRALKGQRFIKPLLNSRRVRAIDEKLSGSGIISVTLLRFVPAAPYTLFNLAAGLSSIRFAEFIIGTFLALLPGSVARGLVGGSLTQIILNPSAKAVSYLVAGLALWAAVLYICNKRARSVRQKDSAATPSRR